MIIRSCKAVGRVVKKKRLARSRKSEGLKDGEMVLQESNGGGGANVMLLSRTEAERKKGEIMEKLKGGGD